MKITLFYSTRMIRLFFVMIIAFFFMSNPIELSAEGLHESLPKNEQLEKKLSYIKKNNSKYNSFIIGGSSAGVLSTTTLNTYNKNSKFYNVATINGSMEQYKKTIVELNEYTNVKNIILHLSINDFKMVKPYEKTIPAFDLASGVFKVENRTSEMLLPTQEYKKLHPIFNSYIVDPYSSFSTEAILHLKDIKDFTENHHINLTVIMAPTYSNVIKTFDAEKVAQLASEITNITPFWNFSGFTTINDDPRYFYNDFQYKTEVSNMMLATLYGNSNIYVPDLFGGLITKENFIAETYRFYSTPLQFENAEAKKVPVLMYHHLSEKASEWNSLTVSPKKFKEDMQMLKKEGYTAVHLSQLVDFVYNGTPLPEKPIVITFDDGYASNYQYAYPILKELDMKATIFMIGWSTGLSKHRVPGLSLIPHFGWEEAKQMEKSGVIEIQHHTQDMHESSSPARIGLLPKHNENQSQYEKVFKNDILQLEKTAQTKLNKKLFALAYPLGKFTNQSEMMLKDLGYLVTLTTKSGTNIIRQGEPNDLHAMNRINVDHETSMKSILAKYK